jgi:hypothetical protein
MIKKYDDEKLKEEITKKKNILNKPVDRNLYILTMMMMMMMMKK